MQLSCPRPHIVAWTVKGGTRPSIAEFAAHSKMWYVGDTLGYDSNHSEDWQGWIDAGLIKRIGP